jgi:PAS domain S-box-containing protein
VQDAAPTAVGLPATEPRWQWAWDCVGAAIGMFAFAALFSGLTLAAGRSSAIDATQAPMPWVPFGIAVGVISYRGTNRWPAAFFGTLVTVLLVWQFPLPAAIVQATSTTLVALGIRLLFRAWRVNLALERWQDLLLLWAAAACGAAVVAGLAGTLVLVAAGLQPQRVGQGVVRALIDAHGMPIFGWPLLRLASCWWANWMSGVALVVPALRLLEPATWRPLSGRSGETVIIVLSLVAWGAAAFARWPAVAALPLFVVALALVTWSAIRFGTALASLVPLALALIGSAAFIAGRGPLQALPDDAVFLTWTFITIVAVLGMMMTTLLAERDAAMRRLAASEARYRALFEWNPQPLWVHDPKTLRILMVNDAAIEHYGYSREEFTRMRVPDIDLQALAGSPGDGAAPIVFDGHEQVCRTRSGSLINVELHAQPVEFNGQELTLVFSYDVTDRNRLRSAYLDASDLAARRLGYELHDGLGQELVALALIVGSEKIRVARGASPGVEALDLIDATVKRAIAACRNIAHGLSALTETGGNLPGALKKMVERSAGEGAPAVSIVIESDTAIALPPAVLDHIYRIAQEAVTNAKKHSNAAHLEVRLAVTPDMVVLTIRDDGVGVPAASVPRPGLGMASMQHRAAAIGARLIVASRPGGGTEVRLECPQGDTADSRSV